MFLLCYIFFVLGLRGMDLANGQIMVEPISSSIWIDVVYSTMAIPAPTPLPAPTSVSKGVQFQFGEDAGDTMAELTNDDCSDPVKLDSGPVPVFDGHVSRLHVCSNGIISGNKPFKLSTPQFFPGDKAVRERVLFAPFWANIDLQQEGKIWYRVHLRPDNTTRKADSIVHNITGQHNEFKSAVVAIVTWEDVQNFPADNGNYSDEFSDLENTFQAVIVSDGTNTFILYIYIDIEWSGRWGFGAVVGYNAGDGKNYLNYPGSKTEAISNIDDLESGNFTGIVLFHLTPFANTSNRAAFECHQWHFLDRLRFGDKPSWTQFLSPVPSSISQASSDTRYLKIDSLFGASCFISLHVHSVVIDGDELFPTTLSCYGDRGELDITASSSSPHRPLISQQRIDHELHGNPISLCCVHSKHCHLYHERRPGMSSDGYMPPLLQSWSFGDPHIRTFDGNFYTFNGHGEYILFKTRNNSFVLEARAEPLSGANATVYTAFSMAEFPPGSNFTEGYQNTTIVHVQLTDSNLLEVWTFGGNNTNWTDVTLSAGNLLFLQGVVLSQPNDKTLVAVFSQQIAIQVEAKTALLGVVVSSDDDSMGGTSGLLGLLDSNPENDFITRNGTILQPDSTSRSIHFDFGQSWQITVEESLFYYPDGLGPDDFLYSDYEPSFHDEVNLTSLASPAVISACRGDAQCLFDGVVTGDIEIATQTLQTQEENEADLAYLRNSAPTIKGNDTLFAIVNKTSFYHFSVSDVNDTFNVTIYRSHGRYPPDEFILEKESNGYYNFTWTPKSTKPVTIKFLATDSHGASSVLQPLVQLCGCKLDLGAKCIESDNDIAEHNFVLLDCSCDLAYTGQDCSEDFDGCSEKNCFPGVTCTDNRAPLRGATCGPCPQGTESFKETCIDVNECSSNSDNSCEQICVNTLGSYSCECNSGFTLNGDGQSCTDVNECNIGFPCHQICNNTNGSFNCSCYFGFELDVDGTTCTSTSNCTINGIQTCEHLCTIGRSGSDECFCNRGYALDENNRNCTDINECLLGICDGSCLNTEGSFACSCPLGYHLEADRISCEDVNECASLISPCQQPGQICNNTIGSFVCICPRHTSFVKGSCAVLPPTLPPPAVDGKERGLVVAIVANMTVAEFQSIELRFKSLVALAVSSHCSNTTDDDCEQRVRRGFAIDDDNVIIEAVVQDSQDVNVSFYVIGQGGQYVVPAEEVVTSLRSNAAQTFLRALGITVLYLAPVHPVPTDKPVLPTQDTGLSTAELVGIICGSVGGVILIILIIGVIYFLGQSKQNSKVNPMTSNKEAENVPLRPVKKKLSSTGTLESVNSRSRQHLD